MWITRSAVATLAMLTVTSGVAAQQRDTGPLIDRMIGRLMDELPVPGLSVAVVRGGEPVLVKGYGLRDVEAGLPATAQTAFYIASATKSFTGLAAALLAQRGVLDLDAPLSRYLPELRLPAPRSADDVTLRKLLSHRLGFENDALVFRTAYSGDHQPDQLIEILARSAVRDTTFSYDNAGYVITSIALDRLTGIPWQELLAREVFAPLGLTRATAYMSRASGWEVAAPYTTAVPSGVRRRGMKTDATMHAAGGMLLSAADAVRWLQVQLDGGRLGGRQIFPAAVIAETHRPQAALDASFFDFRRVEYGLGWYRGLYDGDTLMHHFGSYVGFRSHISFMPQHDAGVAVFINSGSPDAFLVPDVIAAYVYDLFRGKAADSLAAPRVAQLREQAQRVANALQRDRERRAARPERPPHALELYAGTYRNADMGTVTLRLVNDRLLAEMGQMRSDVEVFRDDDLRVELPEGSGRVLRFEMREGERARFFEVDGVRFERVS